MPFTIYMCSFLDFYLVVGNAKPLSIIKMIKMENILFVWLSLYTVPCTLWILPNTIMPYLLFNGSSSSWLPFSQKIVNLSLAVRSLSLSLSLYTWGFSCAQQVRALVLIEAKTHFKATSGPRIMRFSGLEKGRIKWILHKVNIQLVRIHLTSANFTLSEFLLSTECFFFLFAQGE